jgi:hypothetical protein
LYYPASEFEKYILRHLSIRDILVILRLLKLSGEYRTFL